MSTSLVPGDARHLNDMEFRQMCREFSKREIGPRWEEAEKQSRFPRELYERAAEANLFGVSAPEHIGGAGLGCMHEIICIEEAARINPTLAALFLVQNLTISMLASLGSEDHLEIARRCINGDCLLGFAVTEPDAGNDLNVKTSAVHEGSDWALNGTKALITLGKEADVLVLLAQTDSSQGKKGMRFFAVDTNSEGLITRHIPTHSHRSMPLHTITLDNVRVPESRKIEATFNDIMATVSRERIMMASRWLGHMQNALDWASYYAKVRQQFGRSIGANQSIAFQLAQARVDIEATRQMTYNVARQWDSGVSIRDLIIDVCSTKLFASQAVVRVTQVALHVAGGWGITEEFPVMQMLLDGLAAPVTVGSDEIQLRQIARQMGLPCD